MLVGKWGRFRLTTFEPLVREKSPVHTRSRLKTSDHGSLIDLTLSRTFYTNFITYSKLLNLLSACPKFLPKLCLVCFWLRWLSWVLFFFLRFFSKWDLWSSLSVTSFFPQLKYGSPEEISFPEISLQKSLRQRFRFVKVTAFGHLRKPRYSRYVLLYCPHFHPGDGRLYGNVESMDEVSETSTPRRD